MHFQKALVIEGETESSDSDVDDVKIINNINGDKPVMKLKTLGRINHHLEYLL